MSVTINSQPAENSINAAYRPIAFKVWCNQQPSNTGPCAVVFADVYINDTYYASVSVTDYLTVTIPLYGTVHIYDIDIQDKLQEWLWSGFARIYETTEGDKEHPDYDRFSAKVQVKFRESFVDGDGFVQTYGTTPVQATKMSPAIPGSGTATSTTFYVVNSTLLQEDSWQLATHLNDYKLPSTTAYYLSHRPNTLSSSRRIAGGKYFISKYDRDHMFFMPNASLNTGGGNSFNITVIATMNNGATDLDVLGDYSIANGNPEAFKVHSFDGGVPHLKAMGSTVDWDNVNFYDVLIYDQVSLLCRQRYYLDRKCEDEYVRIFFLNNIGTYDAINFVWSQEVTKAQSRGTWQRKVSATPLPLFPSKSGDGLGRMQPQQNDFTEAQTVAYYEEDMRWIKELIGSPRAYIHSDKIQGQDYGLIAIIIEDAEVITLKNKDRQEYLITIKYRLANERINLR